MKKSFLFLGFMLFAGYLFAQQPYSNNRYRPGYDSLQLKKADYSLSAGTSFSTGAFQGSAYYVAPSVTYRVSPKFTVHSTVYFINSNITSTSSPYLNLGDNQQRLFDRKSNEAVVFASGNYQVNNRLLITGSVIKNFNTTPGSNQNVEALQNSFQMMSMGMQYKLTPNVTIGAGFKMIQSNNPYFPYYNSYGVSQYGYPNSNF